MPGPSLQAEIIDVLKSNQEKEDDDVRRMFWQMFRSSSEAEVGVQQSFFNISPLLLIFEGQAASPQPSRPRF